MPGSRVRVPPFPPTSCLAPAQDVRETPENTLKLRVLLSQGVSQALGLSQRGVGTFVGISAAGSGRYPHMLTDSQIRSAKPAGRARKLFDGGGLYLHLKPNGGRYWRYNYRFQGWRRPWRLALIPTFRRRIPRTCILRSRATDLRRPCQPDPASGCGRPSRLSRKATSRQGKLLHAIPATRMSLKTAMVFCVSFSVYSCISTNAVPDSSSNTLRSRMKMWKAPSRTAFCPP